MRVALKGTIRVVPTPDDIATFVEDGPPPGRTPWVVEPQARSIMIAEPDPSWPESFAQVDERIRVALGARVLDIVHIGSTSVPGLPAKPIIDIDLIVVDPSNESRWLPALVAAGFVLTVREPWWHEHRLLKYSSPEAQVHVFGPNAPEPWKHRIFRDHLRRDAADRELYAIAKVAASRNANERAETMMEYNLRKQDVIRDIYSRAFRAAGFLV